MIGAVPARADENSTIPAESSINKILGSVRAGAYFFENSYTKDHFSSPTATVGLDVVFDQQPAVSRSFLTVDYIYSESNGNSVRLIPVQAENEWLQAKWNKTTPYVLAAAGLTYEKIVDNVREQDGTTDAFSGAFGAGLIFQSNAYAELKYELIAASMDEQYSGWQLNVGFLF
jgi:hypothetical protein